MAGTRQEKDSFGTIEVPADRLWGAQTERSRRHFRISGERMPLAVIHALAQVTAFLAGRDYVMPADVKSVFPDAAPHRVGRSVRAEVSLSICMRSPSSTPCGCGLISSVGAGGCFTARSKVCR